MLMLGANIARWGARSPAPFSVTLCRASTLHTKSKESPRTLLQPHMNTMGGSASVCIAGAIKHYRCSLLVLTC